MTEKKINKIVLAYSGGLDTSVMLRWIRERYECEVVCYCADVGQGEELDGLDAKARETGASKLYVEDLREELLILNGVGPETADSILLYAGNHPVVVVDAYTRRILARHEILPEESDYEDIRKLFQRSLAPVVESEELKPREERPELESGVHGAAHPPSPMSTARRTALTQVYNEMHGLIVGVGKYYCRKSQPKCDECPLQQFLPRSK